MNNPFNLNIKTPCHENFNKFSPTPEGGFCGSCQKEVIDFTKMNSEEIISFFKTKETQNTCGRFKSTQLKTYNEKKIKRLGLFTGIGLGILSLFSINTAQAQNVKKDTKFDKNTTKATVFQVKKDITVKGKLLDETGLPLPAVIVLLEGTTTSTTTDFDGDFVFPEQLKRGDILVFSYIGYESKKIIIDSNKSTSKIELEVNMKMDTFILMGKVAAKKVYKSKRKK